MKGLSKQARQREKSHVHAAAAVCVTNDQANFTTLVIEAAGHHRPDSIVHNSHDVCIVVLVGEQNVTRTIWLLCETLLVFITALLIPTNFPRTGNKSFV